MNTVILTDSSSDLPLQYIESNNIPFTSLICTYKGKEIDDDFGKTLNYHDFYEGIRSGEMPTTSQVNVQRYVDKFRELTQAGYAIIYIGFSSALSGSLGSAYVAKKTLEEEIKNADITIIDSKSASLGQGLIVYYAYEMLKDGKSKAEIVNWVENNKLKVNHLFTVDSLDHLKRGGRISPAAAMVGTILSIKPILQIDDEGKLVPLTKVQGRKKSLKALVDMLNERITNPAEQVIAISHGDCPNDVNYIRGLINEKFTFKDILINNIGPVIGSHSGPGTIALFFLADIR